MASKFLSELPQENYQALTNKLLKIQNENCFICEKEINQDLHSTNIDHIIPLANKGKDSEDNFAVTHESCNKSKQDSNLKIARILSKLKALQEKVDSTENRSASLKDVLAEYSSSKYIFKYSENDK